MGTLRKYLKLAGLWIWRLFLAYAIVFTVAASIALVLLFRAAYAPVAKVKVLQTINPKESVFMAEARLALKEAGRNYRSCMAIGKKVVEAYQTAVADPSGPR